MKRASDEFFAGTGFSLDKNRSISVYQRPHNLEYLLHGFTSADNFRVPVVKLEFLLHPVVLGDVAKSLQAPYDVAFRIVKGSRIDHDVYDLVPFVPDGNFDIPIWMAARKGSINRAVLSTKGSPKDPHALLTEDFLFVKTRYPLGSSIPRGYFPVFVERQHAFGDAVENRLKQLLVFHCLYPSSWRRHGCGERGTSGIR